MAGPVPPYRRFADRVHRRLVAVRIAEAAGVGLLAGSGTAVVLAALLLWLGRPGVGPVLFLMVAGAVTGAALAAVRRPTLMAAAVKADEQLGLADLLSTALAVERGAPADPWAQVVMSLAGVRCVRLTPSAVAVRRLGGRTWGGVGLTAALAVTLAAFAGGTAGSFAGGRGSSAAAGAMIGANLPPLPGSEPVASKVANGQPRRRTWTDPDEQGRRSTGGETTTTAGASSASGEKPGKAGQQRPGSDDDTGRGAASSGALTQTSPERVQAVGSLPGVATAPAPHTAESGAGGATGSTSPSGRATGDASSYEAGSSPLQRSPSAPWESSSWSADVAVARQAVESGRVPTAYRDIVRDYFDKP